MRKTIFDYAVDHEAINKLRSDSSKRRNQAVFRIMRAQGLAMTMKEIEESS